MNIATLILVCLTLIIVGVGLFLSNNTNQKITEQLKKFEEKSNQDISTAKNDVIAAINTFKDDSLNAIEKVNIGLAILVTQKTEQVNIEVKAKLDELKKSINSETENTKTELIGAFDKTSNEIKKSIQTSNSTLQTDLQKTSETITKSFGDSESEIKLKIENSLKIQELQHSQTLDNVKQLFQKVIDEIKSPLALD